MPALRTFSFAFIKVLFVEPDLQELQQKVNYHCFEIHWNSGRWKLFDPARFGERLHQPRLFKDFGSVRTFGSDPVCKDRSCDYENLEQWVRYEWINLLNEHNLPAYDANFGFVNWCWIPKQVLQKKKYQWGSSELMDLWDLQLVNVYSNNGNGANDNAVDNKLFYLFYFRNSILPIWFLGRHWLLWFSHLLNYLKSH